MSDKLEMPVEQFAEAVAKENVRLNERIEELENILTVIIDEGWLGGIDIEKCARRVLGGNNE